MNVWFRVIVVVAFALAVAIGALWGRSQSNFAASSTPQPTPTPLIPPPFAGGIEIVPNPHGSPPEAIYYPATTTVKLGERVVWGNFDSIGHSAVADNGAFDTGVIAPRRIYIWTPKKAGVYTYGDFLYPDMTGKVIVKP